MDLIVQDRMLPDTLEEVAQFVLVGREKLKSVQAAIRAMDKVDVANEVVKQKRREALELSELLIDAEIRLGELTQAMERNNEFHGNRYKNVVISSQDEITRNEENLESTPSYDGISNSQDLVISSQDEITKNNATSLHDEAAKDNKDLVTSLCDENTKSAAFPQGNASKNSKISKTQTIKELGFNHNQVHQFETMAKNKDLVQEYKEQHHDKPITRSGVIDFIKGKNKQKEEREAQYKKSLDDIDKSSQYLDELQTSISKFLKFDVDKLEENNKIISCEIANLIISQCQLSVQKHYKLINILRGLYK